MRTITVCRNQCLKCKFGGPRALLGLTAPAAQSGYSANTRLSSTSSAQDRRTAPRQESIIAPERSTQYPEVGTEFRRHWS